MSQTNLSDKNSENDIRCVSGSTYWSFFAEIRQTCLTCLNQTPEIWHFFTNEKLLLKYHFSNIVKSASKALSIQNFRFRVLKFIGSRDALTFTSPYFTWYNRGICQPHRRAFPSLKNKKKIFKQIRGSATGSAFFLRSLIRILEGTHNTQKYI